MCLAPLFCVEKNHHMSESSLTIMAIFAHPDDEIGVGSTLAHYSDAGVHTVLVCASRGEVATIFCDDCATRENLAEVRTGELECACENIGIQELRWLDWPDGGIKSLPRDAAIREVVRAIRELCPQVIITHPEHGLYPHPDHLAMWEIVAAAFDAAADPAQYPDAGEPWAAARLFTRAIPQTIFERAPGLADFRVELNGELLPFYGTPDDEIAVTMHVGDWVPRRMAAWDCHKSQHNPKGFSTTMPDGVREDMAANEHFLMPAARVPLPAGVRDDLLAGLIEDDGRQTEDEGPADEGTASEVRAEPTAGYLRVLRDELAAHLALTELARRYLTNLPEQKYASVLRRVADDNQEITYWLARALRVAGDPPGDVKPLERIRRQGARQDRVEDQLRFLRFQMEQSVRNFERYIQAAEDGEQRRLWQDLAASARGAHDELVALGLN